MQGAQAPQPRVGAFKWIAAAAALLVVLVGAWFFFAARERAEPTGQVASSQESSAPEVPTELDLRKYAVTRSDQKQSDRPPLPLPRGRLSVTILLPRVRQLDGVPGGR